MTEKNGSLKHCFLLTACTLSPLLCKLCVCVSEGKFQSGGSKVCLRFISDHLKARPSSLLLYDSRPQLHFFLRAHYSGRCPIVPSLRAFSWAYQKHNTKICREEEEEEEGWPESKWRSPRETLPSKEETMLCFTASEVGKKKKRCLVPAAGRAQRGHQDRSFWRRGHENWRPPSGEVHLTKVQCCPCRNDVVRTRACPAVWACVCACVRALLWPHWKVLLVWKKYNKGAVDRCFDNRRTTDALVF